MKSELRETRLKSHKIKVTQSESYTMSLQILAVFVALADREGAALAEFYRHLFAVAPTVQSSSYTEFTLPGLRLGIFQPKADHRQEFQGGGGSISLCVEVEQLETAIERLTELGAPVGEISVASHGRELYAYDPAGNRLILHQRLSQQT
jgi:predicted enzyme related to lactoylglutathione lyase